MKNYTQTCNKDCQGSGRSYNFFFFLAFPIHAKEAIPWKSSVCRGKIPLMPRLEASSHQNIKSWTQPDLQLPSICWYKLWTNHSRNRMLQDTSSLSDSDLHTGIYTTMDALCLPIFAWCSERYLSIRFVIKFLSVWLRLTKFQESTKQQIPT